MYARSLEHMSLRAPAFTEYLHVLSSPPAVNYWLMLTISCYAVAQWYLQYVAKVLPIKVCFSNLIKVDWNKNKRVIHYSFHIIRNDIIYVNVINIKHSLTRGYAFVDFACDQFNSVFLFSIFCLPEKQCHTIYICLVNKKTDSITFILTVYANIYFRLNVTNIKTGRPFDPT